MQEILKVLWQEKDRDQKSQIYVIEGINKGKIQYFISLIFNRSNRFFKVIILTMYWVILAYWMVKSKIETFFKNERED